MDSLTSYLERRATGDAVDKPFTFLRLVPIGNRDCAARRRTQPWLRWTVAHGRCCSCSARSGAPLTCSSRSDCEISRPPWSPSSGSPWRRWCSCLSQPPRGRSAGFATGVAFVIFYGLIASIGPARAFLVTYIAPGFAVVYGALLLSERVGVATLIGLALILSGSWLAAEGRLPGRPRPGVEEGPPSMPVADPAPGETP